MSNSSNGRAKGSRYRVRYTEQPFPPIEAPTPPPPNQQAQSLLFRLPNKLRGRIFDLALSTHADSVYINAALSPDGLDRAASALPEYVAPPSTALLRTCRLAWVECELLFYSAIESYWQKEFVIDVHSDIDMWRSLDWIPNEFLAQIRQFEFILTSRNDAPVSFVLKYATDARWYLLRANEWGISDIRPLMRGLAQALEMVNGRRGMLKFRRTTDGPFHAYTREGLQYLLMLAEEAVAEIFYE